MSPITLIKMISKLMFGNDNMISVALLLSMLITMVTLSCQIIFIRKHFKYTALFDSKFFCFFCSLFEILQSLYWAIYGLIDLEDAHLDEPHKFTELIGKLMFGTYSLIAIIVLLNMLVAMMSNSYHIISVRNTICVQSRCLQPIDTVL